MLTLTNVQIVYDNAIEAVREASLTLSKGSIVALLGANGAGKIATRKLQGATCATGNIQPRYKEMT